MISDSKFSTALIKSRFAQRQQKNPKLFEQTEVSRVSSKSVQSSHKPFARMNCNR